MNYPDSFLHLLECFKHLPGIGTKSAERLVYHCLNMPDFSLEEFADALMSLKKDIDKQSWLLKILKMFLP